MMASTLHYEKKFKHFLGTRARAMSQTLVCTGPSTCVFVSGNFWRELSRNNWSLNYIFEKQPLPSAQHGFVEGPFIIKNLLSCDALIADFDSRKAAYDIIAFTFKKAFDKVSHNRLLPTLHHLCH